MKITKIEICNFRGFPGPGKYTFDLGDGRNLLLYGDNGSGKSSLFRVLDSFLTRRSPDHPFSRYRNVFAKDEAGAEFTGGHVKVTLGEGTPSELCWPSGAGQPPGDPRVRDAALRKGSLEYRSLLRTSFVDGELPQKLFSLAADVLLANIPVTLAGQPERRLGEYWRLVHIPKTHHARNLNGAVAAASQFSQAMAAVLPTVQTKANEILAMFGDLRMSFTLTFGGLRYNGAKRGSDRAIDGKSLDLAVTFSGVPIPRHETFLNEARLSALALSLYFAATLLSNPAPPAGGFSPLKLLVLDDVLIGLDLCHRQPLLGIIRELFRDYQVLLLTYDRHWFEVAKRELGDDWIKAELHEAEDGHGHPKPVLIMPSLSDYEHAEAYFELKDYPACANYLRKVCEAELARFLPEHCRRKEESNGEIGYVRKLEELYSRFSTYLTDHGCATAPFERFPTIKAALLNPLSHADISVPVYRGELETAFEFADRLRSLRSVVVANAGTELVVAKTDAAGQTWEYRIRVKQWESLSWLEANGVGWYERCEARPVKLKLNADVQNLQEHDDTIQRLYDRYCVFTKVPKATPYDDFRLPDGRSLDDRRKELLQGTAPYSAATSGVSQPPTSAPSGHTAP